MDLLSKQSGVADTWAAGVIPSVAAATELNAIRAITRGDPRICVAILDGPVDTTHPSLAAARLTQVETLASARGGDGPACRHGTHVASIIFGQPGSAVEGIAPNCSGIIAPVFANGPGGSLIMCSQLDLARAILQAIEHGAHVINISGGQLSATGAPEPLLERAIQACAEQNVLLVAAAGNDGCDCLHVPAAVDTVLSVGAMDAFGAPLQISNWGDAYGANGILAPGQHIAGAVPGGDVRVGTGTSFAAPIVSATAALLLSIQCARGEKPDPHAVRVALLKSASPCSLAGSPSNRRCLAGCLNPEGALNLLTAGGMTMSEMTTIAPGDQTNEAPSTSATSRPSEPDPVSPTQAIGAAVPASANAIYPSEASPPIQPMPASDRAPALIAPSDCGCGGGANCTCGTAKTAQLVYALGKIGYDFGTEARRDSFQQAMGKNTNPHDPAQMINYISEHPYEAESLIWTLNLDATPIYAVIPAGPFGSIGYERLRTAFEGQVRLGVEMASIPGTIAGAVTLLSGQTVPAVIPSVRGMYSWAPQPLIESVLGPRPQAREAQDQFDSRAKGLIDFLNRIYYDLRNLGVTGGDRALNYAATNAFQASQVIDATVQDRLELDRINILKSPICRPDSECYDIEIAFFSPSNVNIANRVFRFTVDVSDVIPVSIGEVRTWSKRA